MKNALRIITMDASPPTVCLDSLPENAPIFAYLGDKLSGMVVKGAPGWGLMTGGDAHAYGRNHSRERCVLVGKQHGYEFLTP